MALCFSFCGKLVHPAPEHNVDIRYLIIWVWFTNLKLKLDHFKIRILHSGEVNKWSYNSFLPHAFVEGTGTILLTLLSSSRHLQKCTSEQPWSMSECYHTHTHTRSRARIYGTYATYKHRVPIIKYIYITSFELCSYLLSIKDKAILVCQITSHAQAYSWRVSARGKC